MYCGAAGIDTVNYVHFTQDVLTLSSHNLDFVAHLFLFRDDGTAS